MGILEVIEFSKRIVSRRKAKDEEKIANYIMLTNIIHTSKPKELIETLSKLTENKNTEEEYDDRDIVNLEEAFTKLKALNKR